ncbi:MAG: hypothetical protein KDE26_08045 [Bacteroidetes bacterium]|nr:hypothetical protein [Bacteroidota bacterium]
MEQLGQYKDKLKTLLKKAKLERVIRSLDENIDHQSDLHDEFIGVSSRYNDLKREEGTGAISSQEVRNENNGIRKGLLSLINRLEEEDLADFRMYREKLEGYERLIEGYENRLEEYENRWKEMISKVSRMQEENIKEIESYKSKLKEIASKSNEQHKIYLTKLMELNQALKVTSPENDKIDLAQTIFKMKVALIFLLYKDVLVRKNLSHSEATFRTKQIGLLEKSVKMDMESTVSDEIIQHIDKIATENLNKKEIKFGGGFFGRMMKGFFEFKPKLVIALDKVWSIEEPENDVNQ